MSKTQTATAGVPAQVRASAFTRWAPLVYALFFLSGLTSLIYEVIWTRQFGLVFGVTTYAVSTVLSAFFTGLAIGSYAAGRLIDRSRLHPLFIYGGMEGAIGLYALALPFLLKLVEASYPALYSSVGQSFALFTLFRFLASFVVLVIPTTLMGATLPVLSKLMVDRESVLGLNVGRLYAINTTGAVVGSFTAGFVLIATFGIPHTILIAALGNFFLAACAMSMSQVRAFAVAPVATRHGDDAPEPKPARRPLTATDRIILTLAFTSGLAILALEVVWTKSLVLILGSTAYAFAAMLTAVLVGIAVGSAVFAGSADVTRDRGVLVATLLFLGGLVAVLGPGIINKLPYIFLQLWDLSHGVFAMLVVAQFLTCFLLVFIPTFLSGASFPILVRMHSRGIAEVGSTVADVYAINTFGGILGSLLGGFVLVKFFGIDTSFTIAALVLMALGGPLAMLLARSWPRKARLAIAGGMLAVVIFLAFVHPRFDTKMLFGSWGPFAGGLYSQATGSTVDVTDRYMQKMIYHKEGVSAAVDVVDTGYGERLISINAQPVATTYLPDMRALKLLGHLPVLMSPHPKQVLLIGMGAGVSSGIISSYPEVQQVTTVELNDEVPDGTAHFAKWNFDVIGRSNWRKRGSRKINVVINDGANFVKATRQQYDVMSSDPIHPFILGNGTLYSTDHWKICKSRLTPGGVIAQWIPMYQLSPTDWATIVRSFTTAFPNSVMFYSGIDVVLVGFKDDHQKIDLDRMAHHMGSSPTIARDLLTLGAHSVGDVLGWLVAGPAELQQMGAGARLNTVDRPVLEYTAPRALNLTGVTRTMPALLTALESTPSERIRQALDALCTRPLTAQELYDASSGRAAQRWVMRAEMCSTDYSDQYLQAMLRARALRPNDQFIAQELAEAQMSAGLDALDDQAYARAYDLYHQAMRNDPENARALTGALEAAMSSGNNQLAKRLLAEAPPELRDVFMVLVYEGAIAMNDRDYDAARRAYERAGWGDGPPHGRALQEAPGLYIGLGTVEAVTGNRKKAKQDFDRALAVATNEVETLQYIVDNCVRHGVADQVHPYAWKLVDEATEMIAEKPGSSLYYNYRALAYDVLGERALADRDRASAVSLSNWWTGPIATLPEASASPDSPLDSSAGPAADQPAAAAAPPPGRTR